MLIILRNKQFVIKEFSFIKSWQTIHYHRRWVIQHKKSVNWIAPNLANMSTHLFASLYIWVTVQLGNDLIRFLQIVKRGSNMKFTVERLESKKKKITFASNSVLILSKFNCWARERPSLRAQSSAILLEILPRLLAKLVIQSLLLQHSTPPTPTFLGFQ